MFFLTAQIKKTFKLTSMDEILKIRLPRDVEKRTEILLKIGELLKQYRTIHCSIDMIKEGEVREVCMVCRDSLTAAEDPGNP